MTYDLAPYARAVKISHECPAVSQQAASGLSMLVPCYMYISVFIFSFDGEPPLRACLPPTPAAALAVRLPSLLTTRQRNIVGENSKQGF